MSVTPSGVGDPHAIVCRAPQALTDSGAMGPKLCMHNSVWARLTLTGQDLSADGKSVFARPTTADPTGEGNPDAVTCRRPVPVTASRTRHGPEVCLTNRYWKELAANQKRVDTNGQIVSTRIYGPAGAGPDGIPVVAAEMSPPL
ncbi:MAG TPA: hypothetical protein VNN98_05735 [Rhizomicrobium sp.]|nr:hypothetical protein [Rhizomicrobium sp.]